MRFNFLPALFFFLYFIENATGQSVRHTYRFYDDLLVAQPQCGPALSQVEALGSCSAGGAGGTYTKDLLPCGVQRTVYHNNMNWGLMYPNDEGAITDNYSIQMYIKVTDWGTTWARIIDFSNGALDEGIYFKSTPGSEDRCLDFYPSGVAGACPFLNKSSYYLLTFTRNGQTGIMDVYVNNTLFTSYQDTQRRYVGKAGTPIYLFRDDRLKACESGTANFAYLSFTNEFFSQTQVDSTFKDICFSANINTYADFSISPNPSCGFPKNIIVTYTGPIPAPGTGYSFNWEWGDAKVISGSGMGPYVVSWDSGGSKDVALTVVNNACGNSLYNRKQAIISTLDLEANTLSGTCETGSGGKITLAGSKGIEPYQYSLDSVNYQTDPIFVVPTGSYRVYVKDQNGCTVAKTVAVKFESDISLGINADTVVCAGESVVLSATGNGETFSWSPAIGLNDPLSKTPTASPENSTQYVITATKGFCTISDTVQVEVLPKIQVSVTPDAVIEYNVPFQLSASSPQILNLNGATFAWSPPDGLNNPASQSPVTILQEEQTYTVEITSEKGCKGTGQVHLSIKRTESIVIPAAFTPNGDGKNEVLLPILNDIISIQYFRIYNRWGQVVFATDQLNAAWDGSFKGAKPVSGTYVWEIEGTSGKGRVIHKKGSVMLLQ